MVSLRCKMVVKAVLEQMNIMYRTLELGEVDVLQDITPEQHEELKKNLSVSGL